MSEPMVVSSMGLFSSVGITTAQSCAAIRAGIAGFSEVGISNNTLQMQVAAQAPLHPPASSGQVLGRLSALAKFALQECLQTSGFPASETALLMGVREPNRIHAHSDWTNEELLNSIQSELGIHFHPETRLFPEGNAATFRALDHARNLLDQSVVPACIVGGVDSLVNAVDIERFSSLYRIYQANVGQGFIPGEAAGFIEITKPEVGCPPHGYILGVGLAKEEPRSTAVGDQQSTGKGLCDALLSTLESARIEESAVGLRLSDLNGEYYRGMESMYPLFRFYKTTRQHLPTWLPAASVGETGAAAGALLIIVALVGMKKGYAPAQIAMCETSSDQGLRGGCLVGGLGWLDP